MIDPSLTNSERKTLMAFFTRPQPVGGIRTKGMPKARAKAYLTALENLAYDAKVKQDDAESHCE